MLRLRTGSEPAALCVGTDGSVSVQLQITDIVIPINGVQVLLAYDRSSMTLRPSTSTEAPGWTRIALLDNNGQVTYALVNTGGSVGPGDGPFTLATLVFDPTAEGVAGVSFRADSPPFTTKLTLANGAGIISGPDLGRADSGIISIDDTVPRAAND